MTRIILALSLALGTTYAQLPARLAMTGDPSFGYSNAVVVCDDLDGDGVDDIAIGTAPPPNFGPDGRVELRSSLDGSLIGEILPPPGDVNLFAKFATKIALVSDHDGDGVREIAVWRDQGLRGFFSPVTLTMVKNLGFVGPTATDVLGLDDSTGDGIPEYAIHRNAPGSGDFALLEIINGATDAVIASVSSPGGVGDCLVIEDVDFDGFRDLIRAAVSVGPLNLPPTVETISGASGAVISSRSGPNGFGLRLSRGEIFAGGGREIVISTNLPANRQFEIVEPFSLTTLITEPMPANFSSSFTSRTQPADVDGDGFDEIVCEYDNALYVYDQGAFSTVPFAAASQPIIFLPFSSLLQTDVIRDRDGFDDVVLGYSPATTNIPTVATFGIHGGRPYGSPSGFGSTVNLDWVPFADAAHSGELQVTGAASFGPGFILTSLLPDDFNVFGIDILVNTSPFAQYSFAPVGFEADGSWSFGTSLQQPAFAGTKIYVQAIDVIASPRATQGIEIAFVP